VFFPTVQAKTGLTGFPTGLTGFALWAVEKCLLSKEVSVVPWLLLFRCGKALEVF
jgi:hypothetical protein